MLRSLFGGHAKPSLPAGWRVDDIERDRPLAPNGCGSPEDAAILSLRRYGIAVLRNVLDAALMEQVAAAAEDYVGMIRERLDRSLGFDDLDPKYNFYEKTYAADIIAIDPHTRSQDNRLQLGDTLILQAMVSGPLRSLLERVLSIHASWSMGRVRIVFPDRPWDHTGALSFHQERTVTPFAGLHNVWTPLVRHRRISNVDTPGLQMYVGDRARLINRRNDKTIEQSNQALFTALSNLGEETTLPDDSGFVLRPELVLGDVIVFDAFVPHASYIPPSATHPRVSFDIRLFPTPNELGPKPFPFEAMPAAPA